MKRVIIMFLALMAMISVNAASKNSHMFFDLAGVYMGTTNAQFKSDILSKGAIIPSAGSREFENTYDIFFDGEIIRLFSIKHNKPDKIDRIGVMIYRDTEDEIINLLKSFTKRELSLHNCVLEEFEVNGYQAYALLVFSPKDKEQKKDPVGTIDIRIVYDEDEMKFRLHIIYDDWID